jgi:hypothetical protein
MNHKLIKLLMISKTQLKKRKKIKKPEFDEEKISKFKSQEKKYKYYENHITDFSEIINTESENCKFFYNKL